ncbi:hypothetical protein [Streptomyces sp. NPDC058542]|uniref:hypothetical protein n=1 Tax=Streptomyces sp. NPDC058542 TaxID=3346543 RepID=UPI00364A8594
MVDVVGGEVGQGAAAAVGVVDTHRAEPGTEQARWEALAAAMSFGYAEEKLSIGRLVISPDHTPVLHLASRR